jgi:hypothetical protein
MGEVEHVGVWVGLAASTIGIVLAVVAILFTYVVNQRSDAVNDATIKALASIESDVDRLGNDMRELIRDAWATMLHPGASGFTAAADQAASEEVASGMAAEIKSEVLEEQPRDADASKSLERILDSFSQRLQEQLQAANVGSGATLSAAQRLNRVVQTISSLSPLALQVVRVISDTYVHLTRAQYKELARSPLASAVQELRGAGLLVPLRSQGQSDLVYFFPGALADLVRVAAKLAPGPPSTKVQNLVRETLKSVQYPVP